MNKLNPSFLKNLFTDRKTRITATASSHYLFFNVYFGHYVTHPTAAFQREMFRITEDVLNRLAVIVAFRGSGKSTLMTLSYPIWAIVGKQKKKFVILLSQTQYQARLMLTNLKRELEGNEWLRNDFGPFEMESDEWGSYSLVMPKYGARIIAASMEQSVRGMRHGQYRPDLIIADDVEDLASVKTKEGRDKTHQFITGEVIPAGDQNTRLVVIGNLLHEDSLLMRLKQGIRIGKLDGTFKEYPLINEQGRILWPGKFPSEKEVNALKRTIGNDSSWYREYLLKIISDAERLVDPDWITYYDEIPDYLDPHFQYVATGIDLAISQRSNADYTAMVSGKVYGRGKKAKLYILPFPVNERLTFPQTIAKMKEVSTTLGGGYQSKLFIEEVAYQSAAPQQMKEDGYHAEGVKVPAGDKRERLTLLTPMIQEGKILFPSRGCENLIAQLTGFGIEKHDDLADAFAILVQKVWEETQTGPGGYIIRGPNPISMRRDMIGYALSHPDSNFNPFSGDWGDEEDARWKMRNRRGPWRRIIG
jgi:predicted phage terminase large subunit-like protein